MLCPYASLVTGRGCYGSHSTNIKISHMTESGVSFPTGFILRNALSGNLVVLWAYFTNMEWSTLQKVSSKWIEALPSQHLPRGILPPASLYVPKVPYIISPNGTTNWGPSVQTQELWMTSFIQIIVFHSLHLFQAHGYPTIRNAVVNLQLSS